MDHENLKDLLVSKHLLASMNENLSKDYKDSIDCNNSKDLKDSIDLNNPNDSMDVNTQRIVKIRWISRIKRI